MTPRPTTRLAARVVRFGDPSGVVLAEERLRGPRGRDVLVRVTHASLGATDVAARRGAYVLQPAPGFVPGYDFVGELETETALSVALGLRTGTRVAGVLPRMGAHTTHLAVAPTLLVAVPEALDPAVAATLPLDAVTAALALRLGGGDGEAGPAGSLLVQGASGAVGALAVQLARREGRTVVGTASARTRPEAEALGIPVVDYTLPDWPARAAEAAGGPLAAAIDHTGSPRVREALDPDGVLVHTAFGGRPGHERADAARAAVAAEARRWAHPRERVCSVPLFVTTSHTAYRRLLASLLADAAAGLLEPPAAETFPFEKVWDAHRAADEPAARRKIVLAMG